MESPQRREALSNGDLITDPEPHQTIPDVLNLEADMFTVVGEEHTHTAWGIRWHVPPGRWQILSMGFRRKSDAANWMRERVSGPGIEAEVIEVVVSSDWDGVKTTTVYREA